MSRSVSRALVAIGLALPALGMGSWVLHATATDPRIAFLGGAGQARWIVYPRPADAKAHPLVETTAVFRRTFLVSRSPERATLEVRAFRGPNVALNGQLLTLSSTSGGWKDARRVDISRLLRTGENVVEVAVSNDVGPPALQLSLEGDGLALVSDTSWDASLAGATWCKAADATAPPPGRRFDPDGVVPAPLAALLGQGGWLLALAALAGVAAILGLRVGPRIPPTSPWPLLGVACGLGLIWSALVIRSVDAVPIQLGFDAPQHLEYVDYVVQRHALPLADEGWQMFQPPLYYVLAAATLVAAGFDRVEPEAIGALRALGWAIGVVQILLMALVLRRMVPGRPGAQAGGLLVASLLPCALTLQLYPTNEGLLAALSTGALLATLVILQDGAARNGRFALVGLLLGLAMLAKFSALLLLPPVLGTLLLHARAEQGGERSRRLAGVGVTVAVALVICGWHYGRVWARFGTPFVGGWEARPGLGWWLDPGYRSVEHFLRFGRVLADPLFAGFGGFWDGIYSTMWGDGMLSGLASTSPVPPWWSVTPQSAGYLLALLPMGLALVGLAASVRSAVVGQGRAGALLPSLAALTLGAQLLMSLKVPAVAQDKASYGLLALVALGAFVARGLEAASRVGRWLPAVALAGLGVWAANGVAAFWPRPASPAARATRALERLGRGDMAAAEAELRAGLAAEPGSWPLRVALARVLLERDASPGEIGGLLEGTPPEAGRAQRHLVLAYLADRWGDGAGARREAGRAVAADPDCAEALELLAGLQSAAGQVADAIATWREVLRLEPFSRTAHASLAHLYLRLGDQLAAATHQGYAERLGQGAASARSRAR